MYPSGVEVKWPQFKGGRESRLEGVDWVRRTGVACFQEWICEEEKHL